MGIEIASHELEPNKGAGFDDLWEVAEGYHISRQGSRFAGVAGPHPREGVLVPWFPEGCARDKCLYAPAIHKEIPGKIAKLRNASDEDILNFARSYGLLGHGAWAEPNQGYGGGDPLPWIQAHSHTLHFCLKLIKAISDGRSDVIKKTLRAFHEGGRVLTTTIAERGKVCQVNWLFTPKTRETLWAELAEFVLTRIINSNIRYMAPQLKEIDGKPRMIMRFSALIEVAYWHLANSIGGKIKQCEANGCGAFFIQTDLRQRYCPKGPFNTESPCATRERVREHRKLQGSKRKRG